MEVQDEKNENMADWSPKSLYDDDSDGVDLEVADAAGQKPEAASAKNVAEMDEGNDLLGFDQWMHDTNHSTSQSKVSGSSSKYELELAAHNNDDYYEDAETIEEVHGDLYDDYHYDYADGTLDPKGEIEELDRVIEIIQRLDKMKSSKETAPEKATEAGWQTDVFEMEIDADIEVDQSMEADHGIEIDVDIEEVVECDTEDSRCDELIQAHEEYEVCIKQSPAATAIYICVTSCCIGVCWSGVGKEPFNLNHA